MKIKTILIVVCMMLLIGCSGTPVLNTNGENAGVLPDGRKVTQFEVSDGFRIHYIYVVENSTSVTTNRTVQTGKTTMNRVESVIQD
jgi:hypothetical protein